MRSCSRRRVGGPGRRRGTSSSATSLRRRAKRTSRSSSETTMLASCRPCVARRLLPMPSSGLQRVLQWHRDLAPLHLRRRNAGRFRGHLLVCARAARDASTAFDLLVRYRVSIYRLCASRCIYHSSSRSIVHRFSANLYHSESPSICPARENEGDEPGTHCYSHPGTALIH